MALRVAAEEQIDPWAALLKTVRLAAGRAAWVDAQLADAVSRADGEVLTDRTVRHWLTESRRERLLMARTAKAAVDAGLAERVVRQVELEGRIVATAIGRALDVLDYLTPDDRIRVFAAAQRELQSLGGGGADDGSTPSGGDRLD